MAIQEESIMILKFPDQVEMETTSALTTKEGTTTIKEEYILTAKFSGQVELGIASALIIEESTTTPKFLSKEEQGVITTPKYSSREESEVVTSTRMEGRPCRLPPYIPPHKISMPPNSGRDNKRHPNYKPQNTILSKTYICIP